jgi:transitional endoplasmic reticulum ATPase
MQGVGDSNRQERILIIGATNKPWRLDGAFLRPGRFDDKIYVPLPDEKARRKIIDDRVQGVPMEEEIDFENLSKFTDGYNGADMDYLCEKAKEFALHRVIADKDENEKLTKADFDLAIGCVKSSVLEVDKKEMELWIKNNQT